MHRPTKFLASTSKYLQNFRSLIQESLILVTHMLMLLNGNKKLRILLQDSLKTLLNTKEMLLVKHLYLLDRRLNYEIKRWMWESFSCIHFVCLGKGRGIGCNKVICFVALTTSMSLLGRKLCQQWLPQFLSLISVVQNVSR